MFEQREKGSPRGEAGQVLLIVVLAIIVASTVGLSIATRSIINLRTSTEEAESQKALAAAEAGIERAMQGDAPIAVQGNNPSNNSSYFTELTQIQSSSFLINGGNEISKNEGVDVWFVNHNADGTVDYSSALSPNFLHLYWGSPLDACGTSTAPAAIQAIVVLKNKNTGEIKSYRYAYDSCANRIAENNFTQANPGSFTVTGINNVTFGNRTPETGAMSDLAKGVNDIVFMKVVPIYKNTLVGLYACNRAGNNCTSLPSQGYIISSTGTSGAANRKITVFKGYSQTYLSYMSYGLFVAN